MQKKFIKNIVLFLMGFLLLSILFACMEEPFIEPSKVPYSVLRLGNLTTNMDAISISIDGEFPVAGLQNLQKNTFTEYFDQVAGRRNFVITDPQTGDTLWQKQVEALSYEEQTMFYTGFYHPNIDTSTIAWVSNSDAFTYLSKDPPEGYLNVYFIHASGDTPDDTTRVLDIFYTATIIDGSDTTIVSDTLVVGLEFTGISVGQIEEGHYKFDVVRADNDAILATYEDNYTAGKWTWHYITGQPSTPEIYHEEKNPLPARDK